MTTEIAIMNRSGIALAADSATTISQVGPQGQSHKIFNTANKLHTLSKYAPVGIMIYGNATLMSIPWETIIKVYRKKLGDTTFAQLTEYCEDFLKFLDGFDVGPALEEQYLLENAVNIFSGIKGELDGTIKKRLPIPEDEVIKLLCRLVDREYKLFLNISKECIFSEGERKILKQKYKDKINKAAKEIFGTMPLAKDLLEMLEDIVVIAACKGPDNRSGVVIAGFGEKEIYPGCIDYNITAVFEGKTIKHPKESHFIDHNSNAAIIPFAQSEDVHTFMRGMSPPIGEFFTKTFSRVIKKEFPKQIVKYLESEVGVGSPKKETILADMEKMGQGTFDFIYSELNKIIKTQYIQPVIQATGFLNKGELAQMAETLVNLVSFRKQVTMESETVGGPIDVAIITKGDGFIWIKRKYYFDASLNHHFFNNYFTKEIPNARE